MGLHHKEEFEKLRTIAGWSEKEIEELDTEEYWGIKLKLKDAKGESSLAEQVAIEINALLLYNNVDYIPQEEVMFLVYHIMDLINYKNDKK